MKKHVEETEKVKNANSRSREMDKKMEILLK